MKIAIMQPYFLPYIGYFQLISSVDKFVVDDSVQYIKRGWINRNRILINNTATKFTLSLKKGAMSLKINERYLSEKYEQESERLIKTIGIVYKRAPYFSEIMNLISNILDYDPKVNIGKFNYNSLQKICEYIGINTPLVMGSDVIKDNKFNCQDAVIDIVKELSGDIYINSIGGTGLYSKQYFNERSIDLYFIKTNSIKYKQYKNEFVPNLSIIDVLMFNSKERVKELLNEYTLI